MKNKVFRIIKNRSIQIARQSLMLLLLYLFIIIVPIRYGSNYCHTENYEIEMDFYADFFIVNGKDTGTLHIHFSDTDLNSVNITEEDVLFKGFSSTITCFDVSEYNERVHCFIMLSEITNTSGAEEKSIELKEGVTSIHGNSSPQLKLKLDNHFISMKQFIIMNVLFSVGFSALFFIYATSCRGGSMVASILLWIGIIACWNYPFESHTKIVNLNLDYTYTCFVLFLVIMELSFYLWVGKRFLKPYGYCLFVILFSTLTIVYLSQIFTLYYLHLGQTCNLQPIITTTVDFNIEYENYFQSKLSRTLYNMELSFRYFFTFPPNEYYGLIAILQFCIGKVYEIVVFGNVGTIILKHAKKH